MKGTVLAVVCVLLLAGAVFASEGIKKRRPLPHEYGQVVINNHAAAAGTAPAVFDHWVHRSRFTCRLCHVDVGFAMKAGGTGITAPDNERGYYCGTCHNARAAARDKKLFASCSTRKDIPEKDRARCRRCHLAETRNDSREAGFYAFQAKLPKERFGNGIDWERAEKQKKITLVNFLDGISVKRPPLKVQKDFAIAPSIKGMPEIVFSHQKHTVWNGCELCHPEIFTVKKGRSRYDMAANMEGRYCGVCHGTVAFPMQDCQRCHTEPVKN